MLCSLCGKGRSYPIYTPPSAATNNLTHRLEAAEYDLRAGDAAKQAAAVESIGEVLNSLRGDPPDYSPDYYADLAAKISLRLGHVAQAKAIVQRGLQLQPQSDELGYMSRILARETTKE
jgi:predicted Zn-dependent protease